MSSRWSTRQDPGRAGDAEQPSVRRRRAPFPGRACGRPRRAASRSRRSARRARGSDSTRAASLPSSGSPRPAAPGGVRARAVERAPDELRTRTAPPPASRSRPRRRSRRRGRSAGRRRGRGRRRSTRETGSSRVAARQLGGAGLLERRRLRRLDLDLGRPRLGDERVAVQQEHALAVALDARAAARAAAAAGASPRPARRRTRPGARTRSRRSRTRRARGTGARSRAPRDVFSTAVETMRLALAQINTVVGDLDGNRDAIVAQARRGRARPAPTSSSSPSSRSRATRRRTCSCGPASCARRGERLDEVARACTGLAALVGVPIFDGDLYNACAVCAGGEVKAIYRKRFLPNYGVFDEDRYFAPGRELVLLEAGGTLVGPTICEDMWQPGPPATDLALAGAAAAREHLRVAVPRRQGPRARGDVPDPRARQLVLRRLLQRGRRPGRADLRRPLVRDRRRGRRARARAPASRRSCSSSTSSRRP